MKRLGMNSLLAIVGVVAFGLAAPNALAQATIPSKEHPSKETQPSKDKPHKEGEKHKDGEKPKDGDKAKAGGVKPGDAAPVNFTLPDTDGKEHSLSSETQGKIVVIQWFNPDCPFVVKHYGATKTFNDLYAQYHSKGVEFIAVNSGAKGMQGHGKDRNAKAKKDWEIPYAILLDENGEMGKAYGATNTPQMFIIGKDGKVAYAGAIDDDRSEKVGKTNYVAKALDEILANKPVTTAQTRPYGCNVKYAK